MKYCPCFLGAVCALAAVGLCVFLHNEIAWILTAAGIILAAVFLWIFRKEDRTNIAVCGICCLLCISSFSYAYLTEYSKTFSYAGKIDQITARVLEPMSDSFRGERRYLLAMDYIGRKEIEKPVELALTSGDREFAVGDTIQFYAEPVRYAGNVYSDLGRGIFLKASLSRDSMLQEAAPSRLNFSMKCARQREELIQKVQSLLPERLSGIFCGMLYGEKQALESKQLFAFRYSGFAHLLAVSGLHIQVAAGILCGLLECVLWFYRYRRYISRVIALPAVWLFILLIGSPDSAVRSGIMITVSVLGYFIMRRSDTLNSLGISIIIILLFHPFSICSLGFWMSILATFGIGFFGDAARRCFLRWKVQKMDAHRTEERIRTRQRIRDNPKEKQKIKKDEIKRRVRYSRIIGWLGKTEGLLIPGISAALGMLPIYLFYFGYIPLGALLFGVFLGPLFYMIIFCGISYTFLTVMGAENLAGYIIKAVRPMLSLLDGIVCKTAGAEWLVLPLRREFALLFFAFFLLSLLLIQPKIRKKVLHLKKSAPVILFLGIFFIVGLLFTHYYQYNIIEFTAVGSYGSQDVVWIADQKATIFLCSEKDSAGSELSDYLKRRGVWEIESINILYPVAAVPERAAILQQIVDTGQVNFHARGFGAGSSSQMISDGMQQQTAGGTALYWYGENGLNVRLQSCGHEIVILQDLSASGSKALFSDRPDVIFLYRSGGLKAAEPLETSCLILLSSDVPVCPGIESGKKIFPSDKPVTIQTDRHGQISLP